MDKQIMYAVMEVDSCMNVENEKVFYNYGDARTYFQNLIAEWMIMYITDKNIEMPRNEMSLIDGEGEELCEVPTDKDEFTHHCEWVACYIDKNQCVMMHSVEIG